MPRRVEEAEKQGIKYLVGVKRGKIEQPTNVKLVVIY